MKRSRPKEVIDISDDDAPEDRPGTSRVKKEEEPVPSAEVTELREKVVNLEQKLLGTQRIARQFELRMEEEQKRVKLLEGILDKKPGVAEEEEKRKMMDELQMTKEKVNALTEELRAKDSSASEDRERDRARIDDLTRQLAVREAATQQEEEQSPRSVVAEVRPQSPDASSVITIGSSCSSEGSSRTEKSARKDNATNIFNVYYTARGGAVPLEQAREDFLESANAAKESFGEGRDEEWRRARKRVFDGEKLTCSFCEETCENGAIMDHLMSDEHVKEVAGFRRAAAYVSRAAFEYWLRKLKAIQKSAEVADDEPAPAEDNEKLRLEEELQNSMEKIEKLSNGHAEMERKLTEAASSERKQQETIDELRRQLNKYEARQQQMMQLMQQPLVGEQQPQEQEGHSTPIRKASSSSRFSIPTNVDGNAENIFDVNHTGGRNSLAYADALQALTTRSKDVRDAFGDAEQEWRERFNEAFKDEKLDCAACEQTFERDEILDHLCSPEHDNKARRGYVSRVAFGYWMDKLESIKQPAVTTVAADPAPSPVVSGSDPAPNEAASEEEQVAIKDEEDVGEDLDLTVTRMIMKRMVKEGTINL